MKKYRIFIFIITFLTILFVFGKISHVNAETDIPYDLVSFTPGYYYSSNQWTNSTSPVIKFTIESDENPTSCGITLHEKEDPNGGGDFEGNLVQNETNSYSCTVNLSDLENQKTYETYIYVKSHEEYLLQFYYLYLTKPDFDAPESTITSVQQTNQFGNVQIEIGANDMGVGFDYFETYYRKDNGNWTRYASDNIPGSKKMSISASDGKYDFYVIATDKVGNTEQKSPVAECSINVETQDTSENNDTVNNPPADIEPNEPEETPVTETPENTEDKSKTDEITEDTTKEKTEEIGEVEGSDVTEEKEKNSSLCMFSIIALIVLIVLIILALKNKKKVEKYIRKFEKIVKNRFKN